MYYTHNRYTNNGVTNTQKYTGVVTSYFSNDSTRCPITGHKLEHKPAGSYTDYTGTSLRISGTDLLLSTDTPIKNYDFWL